MACDPLADLWQDALNAYERKADTNLSSPEVTPFESSDDILKFIDDRKMEFSAFRDDGKHLRAKLEPIEWTVQGLCGVLGEALAVPFSPAKAIFTAIGVAVDAALKVQKDFDAIEDAFETMEHHLRIIKLDAGMSMLSTLREESVRLLAQVLAVLAVITHMQKCGRLRAWIKNFRKSDVLDKALDELRRRATNQHQTVSAVTLNVSERILAHLSDSASWDEKHDTLCLFLERIVLITQETYNTMRQTAATTQRQNTANRKTLEDIQNKLIYLREEIQNNRRAEDIGKIFNWLRYPDCSLKINALLSDRAKGTGSWFLDSEEFHALKSGSKRVLWLEGSAGCGKSTIMAGAMRDLQTHCAVSAYPSLIMTHFFDATNGPRHRNLEGLASSLLCQLAHRVDDLHDVLKAFHEVSMAGHSELSLDQMRYELLSVLRTQKARIFVVLDALDEAIDDRILPFLEDMLVNCNVSLLLSSRTEVPFRRTLERLSDVRLLVKKNWYRAILRHIWTTFSRRAVHSPSFRWTVLQIKELSGISGIPSQLRRKLHNMPKTLSDTYDHAIRLTPEEQRDDLRRMLEWLLFARGLLDKVEYSELLAFEWSPSGGLPVFDVELRPSSPDELFTVVNSTFISYYGGYIRIAHASVRDHLLDSRTSFPISAHCAYDDMARMCIAYLTAVGINDSPQTRLMGRYHLHYHASRFWSLYADKALDAHENWELSSKVVAFVLDLPPRASWLLRLAAKECQRNILHIVETVRPGLLEPFADLFLIGALLQTSIPGFL
ncbi:hypothetical protein K523DRAFT_420321 [Schizophyllum commune Tattone D]|nr:hypothetical protein K523DRAFT_420321 [Schizophyllum commune Tattone D]